LTDNVVESLGGMPWYEGQTILQHLEALEPADVYEKGKYVFSTTVIRPKTEEYHDFRGYAGKLYGTILKLEMHNGFTFFDRIKKISNFHDKQFEKLR
jgi:sulfate adenylyltransferase subunit 1